MAPHSSMWATLLPALGLGLFTDCYLHGAMLSLVYTGNFNDMFGADAQLKNGFNSSLLGLFWTTGFLITTLRACCCRKIADICPGFIYISFLFRATSVTMAMACNHYTALFVGMVLQGMAFGLTLTQATWDVAVLLPQESLCVGAGALSASLLLALYFPWVLVLWVKEYPDDRGARFWVPLLGLIFNSMAIAYGFLIQMREPEAREEGQDEQAQTVNPVSGRTQRASSESFDTIDQIKKYQTCPTAYEDLLGVAKSSGMRLVLDFCGIAFGFVQISAFIPALISLLDWGQSHPAEVEAGRPGLVVLLPTLLSYATAIACFYGAAFSGRTDWAATVGLSANTFCLILSCLFGWTIPGPEASNLVIHWTAHIAFISTVTMSTVAFFVDGIWAIMEETKAKTDLVDDDRLRKYMTTTLASLPFMAAAGCLVGSTVSVVIWACKPLATLPESGWSILKECYIGLLGSGLLLWPTWLFLYFGNMRAPSN